MAQSLRHGTSAAPLAMRTGSGAAAGPSFALPAGRPAGSGSAAAAGPSKSSSRSDDSDEGESDGDEDDADDSDSQASASSSTRPDGEARPKQQKRKRSSEACTACRRLKMRCVPATAPGPGVGPRALAPCARCLRLKRPATCVFEGGRKAKRKRREAERKAREGVTQFGMAGEMSMAGPSSAVAMNGWPGAQPSGSSSVKVCLEQPPFTDHMPVVAGSASEQQELRARIAALERSLSHLAGVVSQMQARDALPRYGSRPDLLSSVPAPLPSSDDWSQAQSVPMGSAVSRTSQPHRAESGALATSLPSPSISSTSTRRAGVDSQLHPIGVLAEAALNTQASSEPPLAEASSAKDERNRALAVVPLADARALFALYFDKCAQHLLVLDGDPTKHADPHFVLSRSGLLYLAICAVAGIYVRGSNVHSECRVVADEMVATCIVKGHKQVETVQALLLLSMWGELPSPSREPEFELNKSYLFAGLAVRIANDLGLHREALCASPSTDTWDAVNRQRAWFCAFSVDRSLSAQLGKPNAGAAGAAGQLSRAAGSWGFHPGNKKWDRGIASFVELQTVLSRQLEWLSSHLNGTERADASIEAALGRFNEQLDAWAERWSAYGFFSEPSGAETQTRGGDNFDERMLQSLRKQWPIRLEHARLQLNSFGLQLAMQEPDDSVLKLEDFYHRCWNAAETFTTHVLAGMRPLFRWSPNTQLVMASYSCVFLLKLTQPAFAHFGNGARAFNIVERVAAMLEEVSTLPSHAPALHASFLRSLLASRKERAASGTTTPAWFRNGGISRLLSPSAGEATADLLFDAAAGGTSNALQEQQMQVGATSGLPMDYLLDPDFWSSVHWLPPAGPDWSTAATRMDRGDLHGTSGLFDDPLA